MLFCDCVQDYFRTYLVQQHGYGPNTLASYRDTFKLLIDYLDGSVGRAEGLEMRDVDGRAVAGFAGWLESSRGNAVSTRNVRLAHVKSFASYVMHASPEDAGACASIAAVPLKKKRSGQPDSLTKDEVACLLSAPGTGTASGLRDSAMLALLYDSACRAQELADLDVRDVVTRGACHVSVVGKGRKGRRIPILRETGKLLGAYIEAFGLGRDSPLFVNRSGGRLTRAGVSNVVERHWEKVRAARPDIAEHEKVKPHLLRHSKATHLVEADVNIYYVRDFLGHSSVETTQVYLKSNAERIRAAVESAAAATAAPSAEYYTPDKRAELMAFLETLI